jgi:hypothetical protein
MSKKLPKTITLKFLRKHFSPDASVFKFWKEYFNINNTPLLEDFVESCWENMDKSLMSSIVVEKIIRLYLNKKMANLYTILCVNIGTAGNKYKEWRQIDLAFIKFLRGDKK